MTASSSTLARTQFLLERLYDIETGTPIENFLLGANRSVAVTGVGPTGLGAQLQEGAPEALLCRSQADGSVEVALYIARDVLARLDRNRPLLQLHEHNLADFFTLLEGVSHFINVAWAFDRGEAVSAFDLELQGELDKFAVAVWLWHRQRQAAARRHRQLFVLQFERFELRPGMATATASRYRDANRAAARIVRRWLADDVDHDPDRLVRTLRHWCRQGRYKKLSAY